MNSKALVLLLSILVLGQALYGSNTKVKILTQANFQKEVIQSKELWLVEFFAPWCGHCKNLAPEWEKAAKALEGIVNIGAVDMTTDQSVGAPYNVQGFPTIKFFGDNKQSPSEYNSGRTAKDIIEFALNQAKQIANSRIGQKSSGGSGNKQSGSAGSGDEKDVVVLDESNFDELVMNSKDAWFIEFYAPWCGHCKNLAPHWAALGTELKKDGIKVGKVDATQNGNLASKFSVSGYPTLKFFPAGAKAVEIVIPYNGGRDTSSMASFAREEALKTSPVKFTQLVNQDVYNEYCRDFHGACVIAFLPHIYDTTAEERNNYIQIIDEIALKNKGKPLTFLWSEGGAQFDLEDNFQANGSGYPALIAVSHKKQVYSIMRSSFSQKNIEGYLTQLLSGRGQNISFKSLPKIKKVAEWDGQDAKPRSTGSEEGDL